MRIWILTLFFALKFTTKNSIKFINKTNNFKSWEIKEIVAVITKMINNFNKNT